MKSFLTYLVPLTLLRRRLSGNYRRAIAASLAVSLVRLIDRLIAIRAQSSDSKLFQLRWLFGGFIGSGTAMLVDQSLCNSTLMVFWCLIRALRCYMPDIRHGSTVGMFFSASVILSAYLMDPDELDPVYIKFLHRQTNRSTENMATLRRVFSPSSALHALPALPSLAASDSTSSLKPFPSTPCDCVHPGQSCIADKLRLFPIYVLNSVKVYLPLYLFFFLFSSKRNVHHLGLNIARSTMFLSTCGLLSWCLLCLMSNLGVPITRKSMAAFMWIAGASSLFEGEGRRKEIAAYSLTYALQSLFNRAAKYGLVKPHPLFNWTIIASSCAIMLHHPKQQPAFLMKWLFQIEKTKPAPTQGEPPRRAPNDAISVQMHV